MKLREIIDIATSVKMYVKDADSEAEVHGDEFDLAKMLSEKWLNAIVRSIDVQGGEMYLSVEEDEE